VEAVRVRTSLPVLDVAEFTCEDGKPLRAVLIDDEPWFLATDVARIIDRQFMRAVWSVHVDDRIKISMRCLQPGVGKAALRANGADGAWFLSEYGFHDLVLSEKGPERKPLRRWIIYEVIPTLLESRLASFRRTDLPIQYHRIKVKKKPAPSSKQLRMEKSPQALYRLYNTDGELLYVGITWKVAARMDVHRGSQPWWREVASVQLEVHPNREAVLEAERTAIRCEHPRYNIAGAS
jgi:prophage antirepressor-like protein/predicted GIY-YIG superfamily endonuclease